MYTLHYAPDNASLCIRLALDHLGAPYQTRLVDRGTSAQRSAAYLELNPNGLIPALETPDGVLFETGAILLWLADRHDGLAPPPSDRARGDFLKWMFFVSNTVHPALRMLFYTDTYIAAHASETLRDSLRPALQSYLSRLDTHAQEWRGEDVNVIHFYLAGILRWCALYPADTDRSWFDLAEFPALHDICTHLETLPCTAQLCAAEGMESNPFTQPTYPNPPEGSAT